MVNYLDSKRIMGTSTERTGTDAVSGGWVELGRTTLGSAGENITVSSLADKRYYMVLYNGFMTGGTVNTFYRLGDGSVDSGTNYAGRNQRNGAADGTNTSSTYLMNNQSATSADEFGFSFISNLSGKEKLTLTHLVNYGSTGAANAPNRLERADKWAYTSGAMDTFNAFANGTGSFNTGSEVVVLGWDESDTHTNNFWEELASVEASGSTHNMVATVTKKKYLWVQAVSMNASLSKTNFRLGDGSVDTATNYATRRSINGGSDSNHTGTGSMKVNGNVNESASIPRFLNMFIINNSSNEKLAICHYSTAGASGAGSAPTRVESVNKWINTSGQADTLELEASSGNLNSGSFMKVWGAD